MLSLLMLQRHEGGTEAQLHLIPTLALDGDEWLTSCSRCFTTSKEPWYPLYQRLGGPDSSSGHLRDEKNLLPPPGFKPFTSKLVVCHYTNYITLSLGT